MTSQIANTIQTALEPQGVAILIDANHQCMSTRGVNKKDVSMITTQFTGAFKTDADLRARFYEHIKLGK
jgi:GTP cyclohydrolase I